MLEIILKTLPVNRQVFSDLSIMLKSLVMLATLIFIAIGVPGQPNKDLNPKQQDAKQG